MRVQIVSDIHAEFMVDCGKSFAEEIQTDADVLVVAGDAGTVPCLPVVYDELCSRYPHVVAVLGNHEYYRFPKAGVEKAMTVLECKHDNLHLLNNSSVIIDGVWFAGTTLWFPNDPMNQMYEHMLNDFSMIPDFKSWVYNECQAAVEFLDDVADGADVIVTHHIPSSAGVAPEYKGSELNRFFLCDLTNLIFGAQPPIWVFGHTHSSVRKTLSAQEDDGETDLICNPFGYATPGMVNPDFDPKLIIEVG